MEMYKRSSSTSKCAGGCNKKTCEVGAQEWVIDYRWNNPNWKPEDTIKEYLCLKCGDKVNKANIEKQKEEIDRDKKEKEQTQQQVANQIFAENKKLRDELDEKVKNEDLEVKDLKRIEALRSKINKWIKEKGAENYENYLHVEADKKLLQKVSEDLKKLIIEHVSPRTRDIVARKKSKARDCYHNKGIEPCTDNSAYFCCSYCWETETLEFLEKLKHWQVGNIDKLLSDNDVSKIEFINNPNYQKLFKNSFSSQEELNSVYHSAEQDLQNFLKKKGIKVKDDDKSNQIKSNQIKSNQVWITSNLIPFPQ